jgi:CO dehydrogenase maturation factor
MTWTLSITGKGGVGKTTLAGLAVRWLAASAMSPVLAVDADPNTCLDAVLGVRCQTTVGGVREEARQISQAASAGGMGKTELLDLKIQEALVEADRFDVIAMGRPEGPGCYCYANNVLRGVLARLAGQYAAVVIDNEAGLENLSRRTVLESDWLVFVSDCSARGLATARRLYDLGQELQVKAGATGLVVNRMRDPDVLERAHAIFAGTPVTILGGLPEDDEIASRDGEALPVTGVSEQNPVLRAVTGILQQICPSRQPLRSAT